MILGDICTVEGFKSHTRTLQWISQVCAKTKIKTEVRTYFPAPNRS